ncbi:hypothetical protein GJ496_006050 [Pomphorhynchus laevis]|nr:hypothetical protein GJ496_006050 [Pomphorhynchus laevis]
MSTIIKFQPLAGACSQSQTCCYLLQLDDFRILLDCGWDEMLTLETIEEYKKHLRSIDAVLISYPDIYHLGALPYLFGKCGLSCPVYATVPVHGMGIMFLYDLCESRLSAGYMDDPFSLDDVDAAFESIVQLKYCQSIKPNSHHTDIVITPLPAGHMVGGTIWRIVKDTEEHIMYAVDFNHKPERHLNMCSFEGEGKAIAALAGASKRRPVLMITDPAKPQTNRRRARDEQLMNIISEAVSTDKTCLICSDSAGRILELLIMLDQMWYSIANNQQQHQSNLVYISHVSSTVVEFSRSMVEWMSDKLTTSFEQSRTNPFRLKNFKICQTMDQLKMIKGPKIILSSSADLEYGFARSLFLEMCHLENCIIVLTVYPSKGTMGRTLIDSMSIDVSGITQCTLQSITTNISSRVKLDGDELQVAIAKLESVKLDSVDSVGNSNTLPHKRSFTNENCKDNSTNILIDKEHINNNVIVYNNDIKPTSVLASSKLDFLNISKTTTYPTFPFSEHRNLSDDYGELPNNFGDSTGIDEDRREFTVSTGNNSVPTIKPFLDTNVSNVSIATDNQQYDVVGYEDNILYRQVIEYGKTFPIKCRVLFIDFEGRSDTDSVRRIVRDQKPRNLIVVHGSLEASAHFANVCKDFVGSNCSFYPKIQHIVDVTQEKNMLQVYLDGQFAQQLKMSIAKEHQLAWVTGQVVYSKENKLKSLSSNDYEEKKESRRLIVKPVSSNISGTDLNDSQLPQRRDVIFINDPKLSDLKVSLCDIGIRAEFLGGTLMCDNVVAVKRNEAGKIVLEGTLCDTFFKVRSVLYSFYAII